MSTPLFQNFSIPSPNSDVSLLSTSIVSSPPDEKLDHTCECSGDEYRHPRPLRLKVPFETCTVRSHINKKVTKKVESLNPNFGV